ncbi:MAG: hypothetical protein QXR88_02810 [Candidatus Pacearchaeota archaeon]
MWVVKNILKFFLKKLKLYKTFLWFKYVYLRKKVPDSPSASLWKVELIKKIAKQKNFKIFVETGTYLGDTIDQIKYEFREIFSIEIDKKLADYAAKRFRSFKHIKIINGDSRLELPKIIENINEPILFWLDAHYSGGITAKSDKNPLLYELEYILDNWKCGSLILIDDVRLFGTDEWPTMDEIKNLISKFNSRFKTVIINNDILKIEEIH